MHENLELDFSHRPPQVSVDQVEALCAYLAGRGWVVCKRIEAETEMSERLVRELAELSDGRILSGQKGYRLLDKSATIEDVQHSANWLISQGRKMEARGVRQLARFHQMAREGVAA
jgi:hypothetical protein